MLHHELLDAIDVQIVTAPPFALGGYTRFLHSLRAIVELHKPIQDKKLWCEGCRVEDDDWYSTEYPCPTIQAIEKELNHGV